MRVGGGPDRARLGRLGAGAGGGAGAAGRGRGPPAAPMPASRSARITCFEIVESVCSTPVPSVATASKTVAPLTSSLRCSSSSA